MERKPDSTKKEFGRLSGQAKDLRDLALLKTKITTGMSNETLATQYGVSVQTVNRGIANASKRADLLERFENQLLDELVPEAFKAVKDALSNNNATVALEILKGAGILKKPRDMNRISEGGDGDSLELYIKAKRNRQTAPQPAGAQGSTQASPTPAAEGHHPGDSTEGAPPAQPSGDRDWLPRLAGAVHDHGLDVVEAEIVSADSDAVDEADNE